MAVGDHFPKNLPCEITDDELEQRKNALVACDNEIERIEQEKAQAMSGFNADLKDKRNERRTLLGAINSGQEERPVMCFEEPDEKRHLMLVLRADNRTEVDSRPLTAEDLQTTIDDVAEGKNKNGRKKGRRAREETVQ